MLSIKAFDVETLSVVLASLKRNGNLKLTLNDSTPLDIDYYGWKQFSNDILSHTRGEWNIPITYKHFDTTTKLQVFVSLIHLASVIDLDMYQNRNINDFKEVYFGKLFTDKLPTRNRLIVFPEEIQNELLGNPPIVNEIMKIGRIYECTLQANSQTNFRFYYKPYNVPVGVYFSLSSEAEKIFNEMQDFHRRLLKI